MKKARQSALIAAVFGAIMLAATGFVVAAGRSRQGSGSGNIPVNEAVVEARDETAAGDMGMDEVADIEAATDLQVPAEKSAADRSAFFREYVEIRKKEPWNYKLLPLYESYIDRIGANGLIAAITKANPKCHDEAHDLGKILYEKLGDVGAALRTCQNSCFSGCMHGVLMGFFADKGQAKEDGEHFDFADVKKKMSTVCDDGAMDGMYRKGDCAHGVGHALMFLSDYNIDKAVGTCESFGEYGMRYYCATGAYMEYVTTNDRTDAKGKSVFYPCDGSEYPAACFRYKVPPVLGRALAAKKSPLAVVEECKGLDGKYQLGCFHGIGNAAMGLLAKGMVKLEKVCGGAGEAEARVCIEGALERMAKYHPDRAQKTCETLPPGLHREICLTAAARQMYGFDRSFDDYQK
jgi:hypothetical protein